MNGVPGKESRVGCDRGVLGTPTASLTAGVARRAYWGVTRQGRHTQQKAGMRTASYGPTKEGGAREKGPRLKVRRVVDQGTGRCDNNGKSSRHGRHARAGVDPAATAGPQH